MRASRSTRRWRPCSSGSGTGHGGQQPLRVGVLGVREDLLAAVELDELAELHHRDAAG